MATKNDGGPAFPRGGYEYQDEEGGRLQLSGDAQPGMSLRDYFAGQALTLLLATESMQTQLELAVREGAKEGADRRVVMAEIMAKRSYGIADAMLAAR